jgi:hypothetical protein
VAIYDFIPGETVEPLGDRRFGSAVNQVSRLLSASQDLADATPELPKAFTRTELALERAGVSGSVRGYDCVTRFVHERTTDEVLTAAGSQRAGAVHADLHAGNLVWLGNSLAGIIDFASAGRGPAALEVAAFATGTCFVLGDLDLDRLAALASALRRWLVGISPKAFIDLLALTSISFFLEVNANARARDTEWRDLRRAEELLAQRTASERCLHAALS